MRNTDAGLLTLGRNYRTAFCSTFSCVACVTQSTPRIASFFGKHETAHQWEGTHCYIVVPEQVLSYHVEAEPPPGKVKADISACPSRAVVRYHSIFISTIVRVPAGV